MPTLRVIPDGETEPCVIEVDEGETVLDAVLDHHIELAHNCGAVCACSTCHVWVTEGGDSLPEISDEEEDQLDDARDVNLSSRLACQCVMTGDLTVKIPPQSHIISHEH